MYTKIFVGSHCVNFLVKNEREIDVFVSNENGINGSKLYLTSDQFAKLLGSLVEN